MKFYRDGYVPITISWITISWILLSFIAMFPQDAKEEY